MIMSDTKSPPSRLNSPSLRRGTSRLLSGAVQGRSSISRTSKFTKFIQIYNELQKDLRKSPLERLIIRNRMRFHLSWTTKESN